MTETQKETPELVRIGRLREYTLEICRCEKHVCTIWEPKEYDILERTDKEQM